MQCFLNQIFDVLLFSRSRGNTEAGDNSRLCHWRQYSSTNWLLSTTFNRISSPRAGHSDPFETAHCKHLHQLLEAATAHLLQSLSGKHGFCIWQYPWLWNGLIVDRPLSQYSVKGQNVSKHADNPETFFV